MFQKKKLRLKKFYFHPTVSNKKTEKPVIARLSEKKKSVFRKNCSKNGFHSYVTSQHYRCHFFSRHSQTLSA